MSDKKVIEFPEGERSFVQLDADQAHIQLNAMFLGLPAELADAGDQYLKLKQAADLLEKRMELLKRHIINKLGLASNAAEKKKLDVKQEGIRYTSWTQNRTQWKEALDRVKEELVPKTKWDNVWPIVNSLTTTVLYEKVEKDTTPA